MNQLKNNDETFRVTLANENPDVEIANIRYERAYRYDVQRMNFRRGQREDRARTERVRENRNKGLNGGERNLSSTVEHKGIH